MARVIVRAIRNGDPPGRFLRKDETTGKWVDIGDKKAAEKTSQALREKTDDERDAKGSTPDALGGAAVLLPHPSSYLGLVAFPGLPPASPAAVASPAAPTAAAAAEDGKPEAAKTVGGTTTAAEGAATVEEIQTESV